jgi:hypothetical protein
MLIKRGIYRALDALESTIYYDIQEYLETLTDKTIVLDVPLSDYWDGNKVSSIFLDEDGTLMVQTIGGVVDFRSLSIQNKIDIAEAM